MVKREQVERIEISVEPISYVPVAVDHLLTARRWWTAAQRSAQAAVDQRARDAGSSRSDVTPTRFKSGTSFLRLVDVPGACLETVLAAWWSRSDHDDGHLRFDRFAPHHGVFELDGSLRTSPLSRRVPVEVWLAPYFGAWSLLELTPQRTTQPSRLYFRTGHDSLDRFVAALRALV